MRRDNGSGDSPESGLDRRTVLKGIGVSSAAGIVGIPALSGQAAADHVDITGGLVAHYPLDETSGAVEDVSGNNNDGTAKNGVTRGVVGPDNEAFEFDGTDDGVDVPDASSLDVTASTTLAAWVNLDTTTAKQRFLVKEGDNLGNGWLWGIQGDGSYLFAVDTDGSGDFQSDEIWTIGTSQTGWTHVSLTFNNGTAEMFEDGSTLGTFDFPENSLPTNNAPLNMGYRQFSNDIQHLDGGLDDVRIYNRVLSDSEIEQLATRLIIVDEDFSQSFVDNNEFREKTIQDGVDTAQPGDTVWVRDADDGAYEEQVVVDKDDLTLTNAPEHSPTIDGDGNSPAVSINADGVIFNGFTVTNPDQLLGVKVEDDHDSVSISNNTIDDIGPTGNVGATGIIADEPQSNLEIANNVVKNVEQTGANPTNGIFLDDVGGGGVSDVSIANNEVKQLSSEQGTLAILVNADATDVTINGNDVYDVSAGPAAGSFTFAQGINVTSSTTTEVDIVRNKIENVTSTQDPFDPEAIKIDGDASGVTCRRNELLVDISVKNDDSATLDAKCNWWGSEDGPDVSSSNPDNDGSEVGDIVGPVTFEPWLTGAPSEPGPARCDGSD